MEEKLLPVRELMDRLGLGRTTIYREMHRGGFPKPLKIGSSVRWRWSEVASWIEAQPRATGRGGQYTQ